MALIPLKRAYEVDEAINTSDTSCIVIVRFGREGKNNKRIEEVDEWLKSLKPVNSTKIKVYTVSMKAVPELVARYKLGDPVTVLFFRDNIQGGRLQGSEFKKQDVDEKYTALANKKKKNYTEKLQPQKTTPSNDAAIKKETQPTDPLVFSWIKNLLAKMNN